MIENQSDNIDNKENDISDQDNVPEDSQILEDSIIDNDESSFKKVEDINTEDLKNFLFYSYKLHSGPQSFPYTIELQN